MTKLCDSIETLAMAYLDDELAEEELRDFELHLHDCGDCKTRVDHDRAGIAELRRRLAPPPAPDLLRARLARALDADDAAASRAMRRQRINKFVLPGAASVAAIAALAVFATSQSGGTKSDSLAVEAVRQNQRSAPMEVHGAMTAAWVQHNYNPAVAVPRFTDRSVELAGARLTSIEHRDAAQFFYQLHAGAASYELRALTFLAQPGDFDGAERVAADGVELRVFQHDATNGVIFVDDEGFAYVFTSRDLSLEQIAGLVVRSDLVSRVHAGRVAR